MVALALEKAEERQRESINSPESVIVEVLCAVVTDDDYYPLGDIKEVILDRLPEWERWLSERYIGRVPRRLGFSSHRRVRVGYEYFLAVSTVQDCARRLGISVASEGSEDGEDATEQAEESRPEDPESCQEE